MQSTGNFSCDGFQKLSDDKTIRGKFDCKAKQSNPTTKDGSSGASGTSSGSSASASSSEGASAINVANMPAMGLAAVFGALVQYAL